MDSGAVKNSGHINITYLSELFQSRGGLRTLFIRYVLRLVTTREHCPVNYISFRPHVEGFDVPSQMGPAERAVLSL
jgi:hypothetical protein